MVEPYTPLAQRERQSTLRAVGTVAIFLVYIGCAATLIAAFDWRWIAIAAAVTLPPTIEYLQPKIWHATGRPVGLTWFAGYCAVSAVGLVASTMLVAPYWIAVPARLIFATLAGLIVVALTIAWVERGRYVGEGGRRLVLLIAGMALTGLLAAIVLGAPMLRWIAIGTLAALAVALFPQSRVSRAFPVPRDDGALGVVLHRLETASRALSYLRSNPPMEAVHQPSMIPDVLNGVAALQNLHFVPAERAREFRDILTSRERSRPAEDAARLHMIDTVMSEISYAQIRIEAHLDGMRDPDLIPWEQPVSFRAIRPHDMLA